MVSYVVCLFFFSLFGGVLMPVVGPLLPSIPDQAHLDLFPALCSRIFCVRMVRLHVLYDELDDVADCETLWAPGVTI